LATVTYGHHALISGKRNAAIEGTLITIIFAIIFTALQAFEYVQAPFSIADGAFGSAFFVSTGLHGLKQLVPTKLKIINYSVNVKKNNYTILIDTINNIYFKSESIINLPLNFKDKLIKQEK